MNAVFSADNRQACVSLGSVFSVGGGNQTTDKDKGRVQVLV